MSKYCFAFCGTVSHVCASPCPLATNCGNSRLQATAASMHVAKIQSNRILCRAIIWWWCSPTEKFPSGLNAPHRQQQELEQWNVFYRIILFTRQLLHLDSVSASWMAIARLYILWRNGKRTRDFAMIARYVNVHLITTTTIIIIIIKWLVLINSDVVGLKMLSVV